jgi:hypothetical protein
MQERRAVPLTHHRSRRLEPTTRLRREGRAVPGRMVLVRREGRQDITERIAGSTFDIEETTLAAGLRKNARYLGHENLARPQHALDRL